MKVQLILSYLWRTELKVVSTTTTDTFKCAFFSIYMMKEREQKRNICPAIHTSIYETPHSHNQSKKNYKMYCLLLSARKHSGLSTDMGDFATDSYLTICWFPGGGDTAFIPSFIPSECFTLIQTWEIFAVRHTKSINYSCLIDYAQLISEQKSIILNYISHYETH